MTRRGVPRNDEEEGASQRRGGPSQPHPISSRASDPQTILIFTGARGFRTTDRGNFIYFWLKFRKIFERFS